MTQIPATTTFPAVTRLDVGVDMMEDRLVLNLHTAADGLRVALVTRRLMRLLLEHYAALLRRTSETALRAPVGQRDEVLRMEHVGALAEPPAPATPPAAAITTRTGPPVWLAVEAKLKADGAAILIGFMGQRRTGGTGQETPNEPIGAMTLTRSEAHRVLAALGRSAKEAGWGLEHHAPWLTEIGGESRPAMN